MSKLGWASIVILVIVFAVFTYRRHQRLGVIKSLLFVNVSKYTTISQSPDVLSMVNTIKSKIDGIAEFLSQYYNPDDLNRMFNTVNTVSPFGNDFYVAHYVADVGAEYLALTLLDETPIVVPTMSLVACLQKKAGPSVSVADLSALMALRHNCV